MTTNLYYLRRMKYFLLFHDLVQPHFLDFDKPSEQLFSVALHLTVSYCTNINICLSVTVWVRK